MGYMTVAVVLNDTVDMIARDPEFGKRIQDAVLEASCYRKAVDVPAHTVQGGIACNPMTVLPSRHADDPQVVVAKYNTLYPCNYGDTIPDHVIEDLKWVLKSRGYTVSKAPKKDKKVATAV